MIYIRLIFDLFVEIIKKLIKVNAKNEGGWLGCGEYLLRVSLLKEDKEQEKLSEERGKE